METRATWSKRVEAWKASGLTVAQYAAKHGLNEASLKWWKWRLGSRSKRARSASPAMSPLTFVEMTTESRGDALELVLASGVTVRVPAAFDATALARLLDVLDKRR
jgi:hypothetical protein